MDDIYIIIRYDQSVYRVGESCESRSTVDRDNRSNYDYHNTYDIKQILYLSNTKLCEISLEYIEYSVYRMESNKYLFSFFFSWELWESCIVEEFEAQ